MPATPTTPRKLHTRLRSTHELLQQIANENLSTVAQLKPAEISAELWYRYRKLAEQIQTAAADAEALQEVLSSFAKLPAVPPAAKEKTV